MHDESHRPANRLARETSAYLRQHMYNPVDWAPWGEEALSRAAAEDKPLLVSIGYSACHWCHVMERESFENAATAAQMNAGFVCIKVDREERPDVDQIYMDAVMRMQGRGGWPLTAFCTSDGRPFYTGTYFPPEPRHGLPAFQQVLTAITRVWREQREQVDGTAQRVMAALAERPHGMAQGHDASLLVAAAARTLMQTADRERGGFGTGQKFPTPTNLDLLLTAEALLPQREAEDVRDFLAFSFREMSRRGLYDPLGGGFHRYCVDPAWGVPHFEKMLYDQGQLMRVYADLWRRRGASDDDLVWPIRETADYLRAEMRGSEGGLYASQDADSEGEEGKFYAWTPLQVAEVLGPRAAAFCAAYSVHEPGNFEGANVLWDVARAPRGEFEGERRALYAARAKRIPPNTDTKRVLAWNALAISGLAYAGSLLGDETLLADAARTADFVLAELRRPGGGWWRILAEGEAKLPAFLDDLSAWLAACLDLHRAGLGERWLPLAVEVADEIQARFFDPDENDLFLTASDGERLPHRPRSDHDGATPHSAGLAVLGLVRAAALAGREDLRRSAERVLRTHAFVLEHAPHGYPTLLRAAYWDEVGVGAALIVGDSRDTATQALAARARRVLAPEEAVIVVAPGAATPPGVDPSWLEGRTAKAGRPTAYVCRGLRCSLPVTHPDELAALGGAAPLG